MPHATADDDDEAGSPDCLICGEAREGHKRTFWGAVLMSVTESSRVTTWKYRDFTRFRVFFCDACVRRNLLRGSAPVALGCLAVAVGLVVVAEYVPPVPIGSIGMTVVLVVALGVAACGVYFSVLPFFPRLNRSDHEAATVAGTVWRLRKLGPHDSFFTEALYQKLFAWQCETDDGSHLIPKSRGKSRQAAVAPAITPCPSCAKATPVDPTCEYCGEALP